MDDHDQQYGQAADSQQEPQQDSGLQTPQPDQPIPSEPAPADVPPAPASEEPRVDGAPDLTQTEETGDDPSESGESNEESGDSGDEESGDEDPDEATSAADVERRTGFQQRTVPPESVDQHAAEEARQAELAEARRIHNERVAVEESEPTYREPYDPSGRPTDQEVHEARQAELDAAREEHNRRTGDASLR